MTDTHREIRRQEIRSREPEEIRRSSSLMPRLRGLLGLWAVLLPIQIDIPPFRLALSDIVLLVIIAVGWRALMIRPWAWSPWHALILAVFAFNATWTMLASFTLYDWIWENKLPGTLIMLTTYLVITSLIRTWRDLRSLVAAFVGGVVIHNLVAMALLLSGIDVPLFNNFEARLSGMLFDPNAYGGLLVVALALLAATLVEKPLFGPYLTALAGVSLAAGLLLTSSRSAWIAAAVLTVAILVYRPRLALWLASGAVAVALLVAVLLGDTLSVATELAGRSNTVSARLEQFERAAEMFVEAPIVGVGMGTYLQENDEIIHNTTLWFLAEFGLIGTIVFVGMVAWVALRALALYHEAKPIHKGYGLALGFAHLAMLGLSLGIEAFYQRHWWMVMALIGVASGYLVKEPA